MSCRLYPCPCLPATSFQQGAVREQPMYGFIHRPRCLLVREHLDCKGILHSHAAFQPIHADPWNTICGKESLHVTYFHHHLCTGDIRQEAGIILRILDSSFGRLFPQHLTLPNTKQNRLYIPSILIYEIKHLFQIINLRTQKFI